jgi:dienelactone hydrolase
MNPYSYSSNITIKLRPSRETKRYSEFAVETDSIGEGKPAGKTIQLGEYYKPVGSSKFPLLILAHGIGDHGDGLCRKIARDIVKQGIACFVVFQMFHPRRIAPRLKSNFPKIAPEDWAELYSGCVIEIRQIVDWANKNKEITSGQIAILGISLGAIISAISMGVEDRIKAGIFAVAGGNFESPQWLKRAGNNYSKEQCSAIKATYDEYLKQVSAKGFENVEPAKQSYLYDPVTFAYKRNGRRLLMINAMWDEMFPKQSILDFWKAYDEPPILWLPGTHATVWALYPFMRTTIIKFLRSEFAIS